MRSFINQNYPLSTQDWVVSLVCKPQAKRKPGGNPEHAFIIVEGLRDNKESGQQERVYRRYDFVTPRLPNENKNTGLVDKIKQKPGLVVMRRRTNPADDTEECLRFFWVMVLKDIDRVQGCQGASWSLSVAVANTLHQKVEQSKKKPPNYQISGQQAFFPASSRQSGHNCFTWARNQLRSLGVEAINRDNRLSISWHDFLAAKTTRHLLPPEEEALVQEPTSRGCPIS